MLNNFKIGCVQIHVIIKNNTYDPQLYIVQILWNR